MLAFMYLLLIFVLGDSICRRYYSFVSRPHRVATGFLCGLLLSSWWTYICSWLFGGTASPLLWGNLLFFVTAIGLIVWLWRTPIHRSSETYTVEGGFETFDWALIAVFLLFSTWIMCRTFAYTDGVVEIGHHQFPDFGSSLSIMQSFAVGHNFPTEFPHFSGDRIRYHFLFYFQAGNLEYLGLNPALANNVLSILSMTSLLALVMALGRVLFDSRVVGRIAAILFFFHGSLAFIPFVLAQNSISELWTKIWTMTVFLKSGLPYRGEDWGVWSQVVYLNQRHLASSVGIFLIVLIFLLMRYRQAHGFRAADTVADRDRPNPDSKSMNEKLVEPASGGHTISQGEAASETETVDDGQELSVGPDERDKGTNIEVVDFETPERDHQVEGSKLGDETIDPPTSPHDEDDHAVENVERKFDPGYRSAAGEAPIRPMFSPAAWFGDPIGRVGPVILSGILLGLLPMWNGAVFTTAFVVLAFMFLLLPLRRHLLVLAVSTAVFAIPQIIYLKTGMRPAGYSLFYWGYTLDDAGISNVIYYLFFTFGFKWFLIAIDLIFAQKLQRRLMIAVSALIAVAFCFRFSEELLVNHKFLNIWLITANVFVAYGIFRLWNLRIGGTSLPARLVTIVFVLMITIGGAIDLFPIENSYFIDIKYQDDKLVDWVKAKTDPRSIFLSQRYINHQILLAGRRLFYGEPYYAWGIGYDTSKRDQIYHRMFESSDPNEVFGLLKENNIDYVAIDDMIRNSPIFVKKANEAIYAAYFPLVFEDTDNRYANMKIYKVTESLGEPNPNVQLPKPEPTPAPTRAEAVNAMVGGVGNEPGQFSRPRGIVSDDKGNFYVADTGNSRIEKFDPDGKFLLSFGSPGTSEGEMKEPNGVAIDQAGNIYVTDSVSHKLMKFDPAGKFEKEWRGPEGGFYGPRDIVFGPNNQLYIVDQGGTRIAKFDLASEAFTAWGSAGTDESQFREPTGIAIGVNTVMVADMGNNRIQMFDLDGKFIRQWQVQAWEHYIDHYPDLVFDEVSKTLYVSTGKTNEILAFDVDGNPVAGFTPQGEGSLGNPSSMVIQEAGKRRRLLVLNTNKSSVSAFEIGAKKGK